MCQYPIGKNDAARGKATTPSTTSEAPRASDLLSHSASQQRKAPKRTARAKARNCRQRGRKNRCKALQYSHLRIAKIITTAPQIASRRHCIILQHLHKRG